MSGLGLVDALTSYQRGVSWRQNQEEQQRQKQIRDQISLANQAGADSLRQQEAESEANNRTALDAWTKAGKAAGDFQAQPFDRESAYIKAMDARGEALAKAGLMKEWTEGFAATQPLRERVRNKTLDAAEQQFRLDNDLGKYAKTVYGSVHDGVNIASVSKDSTGGLGFKGASAKANTGEALPEDRYTITFDNGNKVTKTAKEINDLILSARDPAAMRKYEFEARVKQAAAAAEAEKERQKQKAIGEREKDVAGLKATHARGLEEFKQGHEDARAKNANASRERVATLIHGGGGPNGGGKIHSVKTDSRGNLLAIDDHGNAKRITLDGKPVQSNDRTRAVSAIAKVMADGGDGRSMSEIRADAARQLDEGDQGDEQRPSSATGLKFLGFEE